LWRLRRLLQGYVNVVYKLEQALTIRAVVWQFWGRAAVGVLGKKFGTILICTEGGTDWIGR
jgi:hypothetical protein